MASQLVEIHPSELKFMFESRKQSSCSVQLLNKSDQWVSYKVKTTNPKKYYVQPNIGSISPNSSCEFIVTMQAQPSAPPGMLCRDKFLVQTTVLLPNEITKKKISQDLFAKEKDRVVEEKKLRVVLIRPPHSLVSQPINGLVKQEVMYDVSKPNERECSPKENNEPPSPTVAKEVVGLKAKIHEAEKVITSLREEKTEIIQQREMLQQELDLRKQQQEILQDELVMVRKRRRAQTPAGYPFLFVCFIGLVGLVFGYTARL